MKKKRKKSTSNGQEVAPFLLNDHTLKMNPNLPESKSPKIKGPSEIQGKASSSSSLRGLCPTAHLLYQAHFHYFTLFTTSVKTLHRNYDENHNIECCFSLRREFLLFFGNVPCCFGSVGVVCGFTVTSPSVEELVALISSPFYGCHFTTFALPWAFWSSSLRCVIHFDAKDSGMIIPNPSVSVQETNELHVHYGTLDDNYPQATRVSTHFYDIPFGNYIYAIRLTQTYFRSFLLGVCHLQTMCVSISCLCEKYYICTTDYTKTRSKTSINESERFETKKHENMMMHNTVSTPCVWQAFGHYIVVSIFQGFVMLKSFCNTCSATIIGPEWVVIDILDSHNWVSLVKNYCMARFSIMVNDKHGAHVLIGILWSPMLCIIWFKTVSANFFINFDCRSGHPRNQFFTLCNTKFAGWEIILFNSCHTNIKVLNYHSFLCRSWVDARPLGPILIRWEELFCASTHILFPWVQACCYWYKNTTSIFQEIFQIDAMQNVPQKEATKQQSWMKWGYIKGCKWYIPRLIKKRGTRGSLPSKEYMG